MNGAFTANIMPLKKLKLQTFMLHAVKCSMKAEKLHLVIISDYISNQQDNPVVR